MDWAPPNRTPDSIAELLHQAFSGLGTDEKMEIDALAPASNAALVEACRSYNRMYHKDLINEVKRENSGNFENAALVLLTPQAVTDARNCHQAMRGLGTDEDRLDEVLLWRNASELEEVKRAYLAEFNAELLAEIRNETSGHLRDIYIAACTRRTAFRDFKQAETLADELYNAGEGQMGTDEGTFARIFGESEPFLLENVGRVYIMKYKKDLREVLASEFGVFDRKDFRNCCNNALDGYGAFIGKRLHKACQGMGTDDGMLIRLVASHRASGALYGASHYLVHKTGKSLVQWIRDECSGDYGKLLVALCRAVGV